MKRQARGKRRQPKTIKEKRKRKAENKRNFSGNQSKQKAN
jgi:hypothetical protein